MQEGGNFEEFQWNLHVPVDGIGVTEDWTREDDEPPAVVGGVVLQVGLQTEPQFHSVIELGRLRGSVGVVERVRVGLSGFRPGVSLYC